MTMGIRTRIARTGRLLVLLTLCVSWAWAQGSINELQSAAEAEPTDPRTWVRLGNAYYEQDEFEAAKEAFLEAVAVDYLSCDGHYGLGLAEFGRGDYQAALFAFNEVTRLCEGRFDGHYNRAVTLSRLRQPQNAAEAFQTALDEAEPEADTEDKVAAWVGLAGQLKGVEDYAGAADAYDGALNLRPTDDELIRLRGDALWRAGEGLEALPDLRALEGRTDDHRVSALIADIYQRAGQVDYAERSLNRALERAESAGDTEAQANLQVKLGLLQRSLGRDADAAQSFERATALDPNSWEAYYNLGVSLLDGGQTQSALGALEQADELGGGSGGEVALALASAYDQLARAEDALAAGERALSALEDEELLVEARFIVGRNAYRLGDGQRAREALDQVVDARPSDAAAQLWAGLAAYQQGDYQAAVPYYERAVQLDPNDGNARVNLGAAYLASDRYQDAEVVYQLLVEQNPQDAESQYNLGWSLISQDRRGPTRDAWGTACDLGYQPACDALGRYF